MALWLAVAIGLSMAAPGAAQQAPAPGEGNASTTAAKPAEEPRICRTIPSTGSRVKNERVCMTRAEWRRYDRAQ